MLFLWQQEYKKIEKLKKKCRPLVSKNLTLLKFLIEKFPKKLAFVEKKC